MAKLYLLPCVNKAPSEKYVMIIHTAVFLLIDNWKKLKIDPKTQKTLGDFAKDNEKELNQLSDYIHNEYNYELSYTQMGTIVNTFLSTMNTVKEYKPEE